MVSEEDHLCVTAAVEEELLMQHKETLVFWSFARSPAKNKYNRLQQQDDASLK